MNNKAIAINIQASTPTQMTFDRCLRLSILDMTKVMRRGQSDFHLAQISRSHQSKGNEVDPCKVNA